MSQYTAKYFAIGTSGRPIPYRGLIEVNFTTYNSQLAKAAAQRYARDNVLHLDTVEVAA